MVTGHGFKLAPRRISKYPCWNLGQLKWKTPQQTSVLQLIRLLRICETSYKDLGVEEGRASICSLQLGFQPLERPIEQVTTSQPTARTGLDTSNLQLSNHLRLRQLPTKLQTSEAMDTAQLPQPDPYRFH